MPKNLFQDMVKVKREMKSQKLAEEGALTPREVKEVIKREEKEGDFTENFIKKNSRDFFKEENTKKSGGRKYSLWIVAVVSVVFLFFALSYFFSKATVSIDPKTVDVTLSENLSATKDSSGDALAFNLIAIPGEEDQTLQATSQKDFVQKATGTVMIYNAFSTAAQPLSIDTRLMGSNGKLYKTKIKLTVPGMQKNGTPGSVQADIYADQAGPASNSGPIDFKIVGFQGTPKYTKFYARSTGSITGGLTGKLPVITDTMKGDSVNNLKAALQIKLLQQATNQIPAGFVLFKDAVFLTTDDGALDYTSAKDDTVPLALKGTLYGLLFNEKQLTQKIAQDNIPKYDGSDLYLPTMKDLNFSLIDKNVSFSDVQNINFTLSGKTQIVYKVDTNKLLGDLLGKSKKEFNQILAGYSNIDSATLSVTPMWRFSIPDKSKDIKIIVNYPQ